MDLPVSLLDGFGTVAVVVLVFWLLATGRLATKREVDHLVAVYSLQIADLEHQRDEYKATADIYREQVSEVTKGQEAILELGRTTLAFIEALPTKDKP